MRRLLLFITLSISLSFIHADRCTNNSCSIELQKSDDTTLCLLINNPTQDKYWLWFDSIECRTMKQSYKNLLIKQYPQFGFMQIISCGNVDSFSTGYAFFMLVEITPHSKRRVFVTSCPDDISHVKKYIRCYSTDSLERLYDKSTFLIEHASFDVFFRGDTIRYK